MSTDAGEALVHIKMTSGQLAWSVLKVTIVVDGGTSLTCVEESKDDGTAPCTYTKDATDKSQSLKVPCDKMAAVTSLLH